MPNKHTFDIKPIKELIEEYMVDGTVIDPFANKSKVATITNDLDPQFNTDYNLDALDFLKLFDGNSVDLTWCYMTHHTPLGKLVSVTGH